MTPTTSPAADPIQTARAAGYVRGVPPWCPDVEDIDAPIATAYPCDLCGKECVYVALHHKVRRSYKAFVVCTACCHTLEF